MAGAGLLVLCLGVAGWQAWHGREPAPIAVRTLAASNRAEIRVQVAGAVVAPGVYRLAQGDRIEDAVRAAGGFSTEADAARINLAQRVRDEQRLEVPFLPGSAGALSEVAGIAAGQGTTAAPATTARRVAARTSASESTPRPTVTPRPQATPRPASTERPERTARPTVTARSESTPRPESTERTTRPTNTAHPTSTARPTATPRAEPTTRPQPTAPLAPAARLESATTVVGRLNVNAATAAQLEALPGIGEVSARRIVEYREAHGAIRSLEQLRQAGLTEAVLRRAADFLAFD